MPPAHDAGLSLPDYPDGHDIVCMHHVVVSVSACLNHAVLSMDYNIRI